MRLPHSDVATLQVWLSWYDDDADYDNYDADYDDCHIWNVTTLQVVVIDSDH